jgi:hypothetical protein
MTRQQYPNLISPEHGFAEWPCQHPDLVGLTDERGLPLDWPDYPNGAPVAYRQNRWGDWYALPCAHSHGADDDGDCWDCGARMQGGGA